MERQTTIWSYESTQGPGVPVRLAASLYHSHQWTFLTLFKVCILILFLVLSCFPPLLFPKSMSESRAAENVWQCNSLPMQNIPLMFSTKCFLEILSLTKEIMQTLLIRQEKNVCSSNGCPEATPPSWVTMSHFPSSTVHPDPTAEVKSQPFIIRENATSPDLCHFSLVYLCGVWVSKAFEN